jgi:hypothetical protein
LIDYNGSLQVQKAPLDYVLRGMPADSNQKS